MTTEERKIFNNKVDNKLSNERNKWQGLIIPLTKTLSLNPQILSQAQSDMLKYRHDLTDEISSLLNDIVKEQTEYKELRRERQDSYMAPTASSRNNIRYSTKAERDIAIAADLSLIEETISLLENHVDFLKECRNTMDKMAYSVTNRIEIFKLISQ